MFDDKFRLILASQSPRRRQLLSQAGIPFEVKVKEIDEVFPPELPVEEVAPFLAKAKAAAALEFLRDERDILLTADSVVILDQEIFGKPTDHADAAAMLQRLSGRTHRVVTGVCLRSIHKEVCFAEKADVQLAPLTKEEIDYYIATYQPFDKAGSYAVQEWIGLCKIERIEGTYTNIMGLPVHLVYHHLRHW